MKKLLSLALVLPLVGGCTTMQRSIAVRAERVLEAGNGAWDEHIDRVIDDCRAKQLPTPAERAECVKRENDIDKKIVDPAVRSAVAALRAFWIASAAGASPQDLKKHLAEFQDAVKDLPPEFFAGVKKLR